MTSLETIPLGISNAFLLRGERAVLIDTGRPADADALLAALGRAGVLPDRLSLILHTHAHWDHCGSTRRLKEVLRVPAAVHRAEIDRMRRGDNGDLRPTGPVAFLLHRWLDGRFPGVEPDILLDDEMDLRPYGVEASATITPGHTAGSLTVFTPSGDAVVGDLLMGGFLGGRFAPQMARLHYFAENMNQLWASVRKVLGRVTGNVYAGHGGPIAPESIHKLMRWYGVGP